MTGEHEHFVHRIEAFSDVVIGFSLAQLGATLVVPRHAQALIEGRSSTSCCWRRSC